MREIPFDQRLVVADQILAQAIQGELTFLNLDNERYFSLNGVGSRMWEVLTTADSIQAAYETLLQEYDVEADQLRCDLQRIVSQLLESGLAEIDDA